MGLRVLGIKEESEYGKPAISPDWHQQGTKISASLNAEPVTKTGGSRMIKRARAGAIKPTSSFESDVDLKRIGHYFKAFLDNYKFTSGTKTNTHEFYGGESTSLNSFTLWETFDVAEKTIVGALLDGLKLEVSDEFMTMAADWIYKDETMEEIDANTFEQTRVEGDIPLMFYDVSLELDDDVPPGIVSSFSFEGKNNLNQDATIGLGSRMPQRKAAAQQREITISMTSTLEKETLELIQKAEYGEAGTSPSECKVYKIPIKVIANVCENRADILEIYFPECLFSVEYEASESDEIEVTFNLQTMGTGKAKLADGTSVMTDMYVKLINNQPEIAASADGTSNVTVKVQKADKSPVSSVNVTLKSRDDKTISIDPSATGSDGTVTFASVEYGRYSASVEGYKVISGGLVSVNETTENFTITVEQEE